MTQRWRERRDSYRPAGEPIAAHRYGVELIDRSTARSFVERHHYSASFPAARLSVGLMRSRGPVFAPELVGVAVFSVGVQPAAVRRWLGVEPEHGIELGRFVLLDDVEANGETWFLARAFAAMRSELSEVRAVLAYSDPVPRRTLDGTLVMPGHVGTIYQAHNGRHVGRAKPRPLLLDRWGRVLSERTVSKIRLGERGADAAEQLLVQAGADRRALLEDRAEWLARVLPTFRRIPHPGNIAYAWPLARRVELPAALPYLKRADLEAA